MGWFKRKKEEEKPQEPPAPFHVKLWRDWIKPIGTVVIVLGTFRSAIADWNDVPSGSMEPSVLIGDRVLVNKLAYGTRVPLTRTWLARWDTPDRNEIVICFSPADGKRLVKRVIAIPGDELELRDGALFLNGQRAAYTNLEPDIGKPIEEIRPDRHTFLREAIPGGSHPVMATHGIRGGAPRDFGPTTVPDKSYFVMGDNRDQSSDSRAFGFIAEHEIIGRSSRVAFSLDRSNYWIPRVDRFFKKLP